ncbi:Uncharacterised protein [Vibrio cholerae]|nr:Uncharacterised protein [Vibrio cholerae]
MVWSAIPLMVLTISETSFERTTSCSICCSDCSILPTIFSAKRTESCSTWFPPCATCEVSTEVL